MGACRGPIVGLRRFRTPKSHPTPGRLRAEFPEGGRGGMNPTMRSAVDWMRRRAESVVAGLLGIMFVSFVIQIVFRYFFNFPIGWTSELSVVTWLYMVLLGSAFWLKESEEIRFDLVSGSLGPRGRRVVGVLVAAATVALFAMALPATIKYVAFMKVESTSYLKIRLDILYSVYVLFAVAVVVRYLWALWSLVRGAEIAAKDEIGVSGL
jgi:TRAP-type C4-dicarboxylate transport system permease small subunit